MGDKAQITRSLNTIRTELEYLRDSGVLAPAQFDSIWAQLPQNGVPSPYTDARYGGGGMPGYPGATQPPPPAPPMNYGNMSMQIAQAAQDPNHPANPKHKDHHAWAKALGAKLGNAAIFGAGATAGSDLVNAIF